ncbi:MAG TPA: hypothetical protein VGI10_21970 [Polyangiaceae bacterium]|jgi:hypothetical protein
MAKLLLLSIIIASIALPARAARDVNSRRGLRKVITLMLAFNLLYVLAIRFLYMHFV